MLPNYLQVEVEQPPTVKFDDGSRRTMSSEKLQTETMLPFFGLARFIEAEEQIAAILSRNAEIDLPIDDLAEIDWVLDRAAEILNRPGFVPNAGQIKAVRQALRYRFSICTGSPGTGKTAVVIALVCAVAARLDSDDPSPVLGVALAGRGRVRHAQRGGVLA